MTLRQWILPLSILALLPAATTVRADGDPLEFFEKEVRPILHDKCFQCHADKKHKAGLRLNSREEILKGGESGPAAVAGQPEKSLLIKAIHYADMPRMPPKEKLKDREIDVLTRWVKLGLPWPKDAAVTPVARERPFQITDEQRGFWCFQPLKQTDSPQVKDASWPKCDIDRLILAALEKKNMRPSRPADRRTLIRRATFDLTGLPPTPAEVDAFVNDQEADAFARVLDRLLASPHYGERWGRHWLDVVRYADSAGETADFPTPHAWRFRNYVIDAFNADKPYDQFLREQLAGDILATSSPSPPEKRAELVIATGYLAVARRFGFDVDEDHYLTIEDTIDTLGKSVLGLTIGCARCHDHKYDPIPMTDYYALYGIFDSTKYSFPGCEKKNRPRDMVPLVPNDLKAGVAYAVQEGKPHNARIHLRGEPKNLGAEVPRGFLQIFGSVPITAKEGSGRLQLADALTTGPASALTARVMVNRIWQNHFGAGLVRSPNDFGTRGSPPSHPELLEYLARQFTQDGWSVKKLHRRIMLSAVYQQATGGAEQLTNDPENLWLSCFSRRRLSAEEIRDSVLAVSGELDRTPGGPHPFPDEKKWGYTQHKPFTDVYDHNRRSVYLMTQRIKRHPFLQLFDGADPSFSIGHRDTTTVPSQALFFLNDPLIHKNAARLAEQLIALPDDGARLDHVSRLCFGRLPSAEERRLAERFLADQGAQDRRQAWAGWVRVLFASNEFLYVD